MGETNGLDHHVDDGPAFPVDQPAPVDGPVAPVPFVEFEVVVPLGVVLRPGDRLVMSVIRGMAQPELDLGTPAVTGWLSELPVPPPHGKHRSLADRARWKDLIVMLLDDRPTTAGGWLSGSALSMTPTDGCAGISKRTWIGCASNVGSIG